MQVRAARHPSAAVGRGWRADPRAAGQPKGYSCLAGGAYTCILVQANAGEGSSPSLSGRVKRLEGKIPELQAKLRKHMKHAPGQAGSSTDSLPGRVEALEEAVDTLLEAQVCLQNDPPCRCFRSHVLCPAKGKPVCHEKALVSIPEARIPGRSGSIANTPLLVRSGPCIL